MSIILVTYDLKQPGRNYAPVHAFLKTFTHCKQLESVWLLDTSMSCEAIRNGLTKLVDPNDVLFVVQLAQHWASWKFPCASWLQLPARTW